LQKWFQILVCNLNIVQCSFSIIVSKSRSFKMAVFWVAAPCRLLWVYHRFRDLYCLHHQGDDLCPLTSEMLVNSYQSTRRYNPEDSHLLSHSLRSSRHIP
jgi:hypothetical protein